MGLTAAGRIASTMPRKDIYIFETPSKSLNQFPYFQIYFYIQTSIQRFVNNRCSLLSLRCCSTSSIHNCHNKKNLIAVPHASSNKKRPRFLQIKVQFKSHHRKNEHNNYCKNKGKEDHHLKGTTLVY